MSRVAVCLLLLPVLSFGFRDSSLIKCSAKAVRLLGDSHVLSETRNTFETSWKKELHNECIEVKDCFTELINKEEFGSATAKEFLEMFTGRCNASRALTGAFVDCYNSVRLRNFEKLNRIFAQNNCILIKSYLHVINEYMMAHCGKTDVFMKYLEKPRVQAMMCEPSFERIVFGSGFEMADDIFEKLLQLVLKTDVEYQKDPSDQMRKKLSRELATALAGSMSF